MQSDTANNFMTDLSLAEAFDVLDQLDSEHAVIPAGHESQLRETAERLLDACTHHHITTLADAVARSGQLIADAAKIDISTITQFRDDESLEQLHLARNTLAAALAACAYLHRVDVDDIIHQLANVRLRGQKERSLKNDEILMLRLVILRDLHVGGRRTITVARHVLADAGLYPSETTVVTPASFQTADDPHTGKHGPNTITAPGVNKRADSRTIKLDGFAQGCLTTVLAHHTSRHSHSGVTPIGYTGTHTTGGHFASASASTSLKRLMKRAGLDPNLEPLALVQWRIEHTLTHEGIRAAKALSGKKSEPALGRLVKKHIAKEEVETGPVEGFLD